ncbi:MAG TPA: hypothetical protein VMC84_04730 [Methanocella sp.]|nr:hypothetical protein [Methanocella sp.]HTY90462.1 hypothetical protein [Methanocella sp.]
MHILEKFTALWNTPEGRSLIFKALWYISLGMVVLGYLIIAYLLLMT